MNNLYKPLIIDKYLFRRFIITVIGSCVLFICIILLFDMMNQLKYFLRNKIPFGVVFEMYFYKAFLQFTVVSPAAALFATIYTINSMAKSNELIAIINSGMSVYRLCMSIMIFGFLFSLFMIPFNDHVVFPLTRKAEKISDIARRRHRGNKNQSDVKIWGSNGLFYKARYYNDKRKELQKLIILKRIKKINDFTNYRMKFKQKIDTNKLLPPLFITNENLSLLSNTNSIASNVIKYKINEFSEIDFLADIRGIEDSKLWLFRVEAEYARFSKKKKGWYLYNGRLRKFKKGKKAVSIPFRKRFFPFKEVPYDFAKEFTKVNAMTTFEARRYISKLKKAGKSHSKELVEYYLKYSFPLVNFIIIIIGVSFGGFSPKSVIVLSFFIAVLIYLFYYTMVAVGLSLGKMGLVSPAVGAWLGNIVFFVLGCWLLIFRKT